MREMKADLWTYEPVSLPLIIRCVTTNGDVTATGRAVMGRGVALQATYKIPMIQLALGRHLNECGNIVMGPIKMDGREGKTWQIMTFPVRHHWHQKANKSLILMSAEKLQDIALQRKEMTFLLPKPGCGNDGLDWDDVKYWLRFLPNNVIVIDL